MSRSAKKTCEKQSIVEWLAELPGGYGDPREAVVQYVRKQTLDAWEKRDRAALPAVDDVAKQLGIGRSSVNRLILDLVEDGTLNRIRHGRLYRYHVTEQWLD